MKKTIALAVVAVLALTACGGGEPEELPIEARTFATGFWAPLDDPQEACDRQVDLMLFADERDWTDDQIAAVLEQGKEYCGPDW